MGCRFHSWCCFSGFNVRMSRDCITGIYFRKKRVFKDLFLNYDKSYLFYTAGVNAQEEEVATTIIPPGVPEANVRGDMIPQTPKDHGKKH